MANGAGQKSFRNNSCLACSKRTAKLDLHICGHCGEIRIDGSQNNRFALVETYKALGIFLAAGPRENLADFMAATKTILDQTKQTMNV